MTAPAADVLDPYVQEDEDQALLASLSPSAPPGPLDASPVPDLPETEIPATPAPEVDAVSGPTPDPIDALTAKLPTPGEPPLQSGQAPVTAGVPGAAAPTAEGVIARQSELDTKRAEVDAARADREASIARERDEDLKIAHADYLQNRAAAEADLNQRVAKAERAMLVDPRSRGISGKETLAVIFGGLGAGLSAAGGGSGVNRGLEALTKKWDDDLAIQKANIGLLKDSVVMARTRLQDVDAGKRVLEQSANAATLAKFNSAIKQGEAQLRHLGVPQAAIDADKRLVDLKLKRDQLAAEAQKNADAHALALARQRYLDARAGRAKAGKTGAVGAGGASDKNAQLSQYLLNNPGDIPGVHRLAAQIKADPKQVAAVINQVKPTESQAKAAGHGTTGLRAVDALEGSKYTPSEEHVQKWLNNQRDVYQAVKAGEGGGVMGLIGAKAAGGLQSVGAMAKSEVEGLPKEAQEYFANVRRLMEPLGRAASGAAISASEWTNFFNQYGPQSAGGFAAARRDLSDTLKLSGVAGRSLQSGDGPAKAPTAGTDSEAVAWAKKNLSDPRARRILKANGL